MDTLSLFHQLYFNIILLQHFFGPICFSELVIAVNTRLPFIEEDDKETYLEDYLKAMKKASMIKAIENKEKGETCFELSSVIITGVVSKKTIKS